MKSLLTSQKEASDSSLYELYKEWTDKITKSIQEHYIEAIQSQDDQSLQLGQISSTLQTKWFFPPQKELLVLSKLKYPNRATDVEQVIQRFYAATPCEIDEELPSIDLAKRLLFLKRHLRRGMQNSSIRTHSVRTIIKRIDCRALRVP